MNCQKPECVAEFAQLTKEMGCVDDDDFLFFHCQVENCHDISLGKTSFHCHNCGIWVCQDHSEILDDDYDIDHGFGDDVYCSNCKAKVLEKYLVKVNQQKNEILELKRQPSLHLEFQKCNESKCIALMASNKIEIKRTKRKWEELIHCDVLNCHKLENCLECDKCHKNICDNHNIGIDYLDEVYCKKCVEPKVAIEFNRITNHIQKIESDLRNFDLKSNLLKSDLLKI